MAVAGCEGRGGRGVGLSTRHIRPFHSPVAERTRSLTVYPSGSLLTLAAHGYSAPRKPATGRRGKVGRFGGRSRLRLLRLIATVAKAEIPLLVTLTFPDEAIPQSVEEVHRRLAAMRRRILRRFPLLGAIWRIGVVSRKSGSHTGEAVPHVHLLAWGVSRTDLLAWLPEAWASINLSKSHSAYAKHVAAGTGVDVLHSTRGGASYIGKGYIAKGEPEPGPEWLGRRWGVWNRKAIPWSSATVLEVGEKDFHTVRRLLARAARLRLHGAYPWQGLSVFSEHPESLARVGGYP